MTASVPSKKPIVLENGSIVVSSVESYDIVEKSLSACSFIARNNIALLLESMNQDSSSIARGDANQLIRLGRAYDTLTSFTEKEALLSGLQDRYDTHVETVFDVYRFVGRRPEYLQGHRIAIFL